MRKPVRPYLRRLGYSSFLLIFLAIAFVGFSQTKTFRTYLRDLLLSTLNDAFVADVSFGQIRGNLFTRVRIDSLRIVRDGHAVVFAPSAEIRYNPLILIIDQPAFRRITLVNPEVSIWKSRSGSWNIDGLIAAGEPDTSSPEAELNLRLVEIQNGSFTLVDSIALAERDTLVGFALAPTAIDFARIRLTDVNVAAAVLVQPDNLDVQIRDISFQSTNPRFTLKTVKGHIAVSPTRVAVEDLIVQTGTSDLHVEASLQGADILSLSSLEDLGDARVNLSLTSERLNLAELRQFLSEPLYFLDNFVGLKVGATGTFARLSVNDVTLDLPPTSLTLNGTISNLHRPEFLQLDVESDEGLLTSDEIRQRLPGLELPDLASLGPMQTKLSFAGTPTVFHAHAAVETDAGFAEADASLDLRTDEIEYDIEATARDFDLSALTGDTYFTSVLNGTITLRGAGTDPRTMATTLRAEIDTSMFHGMTVDRSVIVVDASGGQVRYHLILAPGLTRADLQGTVQYTSNPDSTVYFSEGRVRSLNLARFTSSPVFQSDLNFAFRTEGFGLDIEKMQSNIKVDFLPSFYQEEPFDGGFLQIEYDSYTPFPQSLKLTSNVIDATVRGRFTAASLARVLTATSERLARGIHFRTQHLDSIAVASRGTSIDFDDHIPADIFMDTLAADFSVDIKDLYAVGLLMGQQLAGYGTVAGFLKSAEGDISFSGIIDLPEFLSMLPTQDVYFSGAEIEFDLSGLDNVHPIDSAHATIDAHVEYAEAGAVSIDSLGAMAYFSGDSLLLSIEGIYDSLAAVSSDVLASYRNGRVDVTIPRFECDFSAFKLHNDQPLGFTIGQDGIHINQFELVNDAEEISASGVIHPSGNSRLTLTLNNFLLGNLKYLSRDPAFRTATNDLNGITSLSASFEGTMDEPRYELDMSARGVRIGNAILGRVEARNSYADGIATVFLQFRNRPKSLLTSPDLLVSGTIPLRQTAASDPVQRRMDLTVRSQNLNIGFLDPFLPFLTNLSGKLEGEMTVRGTLDEPEYEGSLSLNEIEFRFVPLDLPYRLTGQLVPEGKQITLRNVEIRNAPVNERQPGVQLSGALTLEGISIKAFDISALGELQLMSNRATQGPGSLYGDMTGVMTQPGVRWYGSPEASSVVGEIFLKRTNLTLPPSRTSVTDRERRINITFVDDTTLTAPDSSDILLADASGSLIRSDASRFGIARNGSKPARTGRRDSTLDPNTADQPSFLDNATYNLTIESAESSILTIIVNQVTNERLTAYLKGRLVFLQDQTRTRMTGEVTLGEGSFYNYIRQFQARGRLFFTGDPENPELDITATYEDFHMQEVTSTSPDSLSTSVPDERVTITMRIQGDRREPKVSIDLQRVRPDGQIIVSQDPQSDAISFLVSGKFRDELTPQERTSLLTTSLAGIGSSILSGPLTEFMRRELGFISSVDVLYYGGNIQDRTDIRVAGKIGDAVIRFGGRVFSDLGNANVNVQLPMSSIIGSESWRNFVFELERRVDEFESANQRPEPTNSAKILYRIIF